LAAAFPCILSTSVLSLLTNSPDTPLSTFAPSLAWVVGVMLATAGGGLRVWAFRALGRHFTFELAIFSDHTLITSGPYALVRHPSYTGLLLLVWGMSMALGAPGSYTREVLWTAVLRDEAEDADWAPFAKLGAATGFLVQLVVIVALIARTRKEDHMLRREFGKQWSEWAVRTPWRLFPGVY
jgi:protein-S-isoprenylcysteine O-methyltransferase Ste14